MSSPNVRGGSLAPVSHHRGLRVSIFNGDLVNVPLLDLTAQYRVIKDAVGTRVADVLERQQFIMGPNVVELEAQVAALSHARCAVACASGTDALLLPLKALGLKPGDEVITTAFTFFATAGAIANAGGIPVFVDIDRQTFNIDPEAIAAAITPRTRAIVVVHLFGQMAPMEQILPLGERHGLAIIEDAAQAIGARRQMGDSWRMAGELGWVGTFSFFPSKNLGCYGDGGMIVTQDPSLATRLGRLRLHGGAKQYHHDEVGTNSRLDAIQAAVLLAKLPYLATWSEARRAHAAAYGAGFSGTSNVVPPATEKANEHIFHQYTVRVPVGRDALRAHLKQRGIGSAVYYPVALHLQPCFSELGYRLGSLPISERAMEEVLSLPVYPEMTDDQQGYVVQTICEWTP